MRSYFAHILRHFRLLYGGRLPTPFSGKAPFYRYTILKLALVGAVVLACLASGGCESGAKSKAGRIVGQKSSVFKGKGQPWTIQCVELGGPFAQAHMEQLAQTLKRTPGMRSDDVFFFHHSDGYSRLYYGRYLRRTDPGTGKRSIPKVLRADLMRVKELVDDRGRHVFLRALMVPMPSADVGNPEWNLANVNAAYSLQVAVFVPTDTFHEQKQAAAEYCAYLRELGHEAYYYHAMASSMVTVGAFGENAIIRNDQEVGLGRRGETGTVVRTYYSPEVVALQRKELLGWNLVNGAKIRERLPNGRLGLPVASQLVGIPKREDEKPW